MQLEAISLTPLAFVIPNILSDFEADYIVSSASPHMAHSSVGECMGVCAFMCMYLYVCLHANAI